MSMEKANEQTDSTVNPSFEREKWEAERRFREREISLKEREQATSKWRTPLVVAIYAAAIAAAGNAVVAFTNGVFQRQLEGQKSEQARILEMIKTGDPDKAAENLRFLLDAGLITNLDIQERLKEFLANRKPGSGPTLPSASEMKNLISKLEYGDQRGIDVWIEKGEKLAEENGVKTKLGRALFAAEIISPGPGRVHRVAEATSKALGGTPGQGIDEKKWITEYLNQMLLLSSPAQNQATERRVREFRGLIEKGDWDLQTYHPQS